jgi:hypothetical protein
MPIKNAEIKHAVGTAVKLESVLCKISEKPKCGFDFYIITVFHSWKRFNSNFKKSRQAVKSILE